MDQFYVPNIEVIQAELKDKLKGEKGKKNICEAYAFAKMIEIFCHAFPDVTDEEIGAFVRERLEGKDF